MKKHTLIASILMLMTGSAFAAKGQALIQGLDEGSEIQGKVELTDTNDGLKVSVFIENAPPGKHGFHIHQYGLCSNMGKDAGGHYNPTGADHGFLPTDGIRKSHGGDLGNIDVGDDGKGNIEMTLHKLSLEGGKYTVGGRAFILHENEDDFGQPTGNAGGRIACGAILIEGE